MAWTDKGPTTFEPKARICGRGYEEEFDDKLRRGSPTVSAHMTLLLCSVVSSLNLDLVVADVRGGIPTRQGGHEGALLQDPGEPWEVSHPWGEGWRPAEVTQEHLRGE